MKKMNLSEFHEEFGGPNRMNLPTAPRAAEDRPDRYEGRHQGRRSYNTRDRYDNNNDNDDSRAESGVWRRDRQQNASNNDRYNRNNVNRDFDRSESGPWRRDGPPARQNRPPNRVYSSRFNNNNDRDDDGDDEWRRSTPAQRTSAPPNRADTTDKWRTNRPIRSTVSPKSNDVDDWRTYPRKMSARRTMDSGRQYNDRNDNDDRNNDRFSRPNNDRFSRPNNDRFSRSDNNDRFSRSDNNDRYSRPNNDRFARPDTSDEVPPTTNTDNNNSEEVVNDDKSSLNVVEDKKEIRGIPATAKIKTLDPNVKLDPFGNARPATPPNNEITKLEPVKLVKESINNEVPATTNNNITTTTNDNNDINDKKNENDNEDDNNNNDNNDNNDEFDVVKELATDEHALVTAIKTLEGVSMEELSSGLLEINDLDELTLQRLGNVVGRSIKESNMIKEASNILKSNAATEKFAANIMTTALETIKSDNGEEELVNLVNNCDIDISTVISTFTKELVCLQKETVGDLQSLVKDALDNDKNPTDIENIIKQNSEEKLDLSFLSPIVYPAVMKKVYTNNVSNVDILESYQNVLKLLTTTEHAQVQLQLAVHNAWNDIKTPKGHCLSVFKKLHTLKIITPQGILAWRDDLKSKKAPGKKKALIKLISWLNEIESLANPNEYDYDDEEDYEDEQELDPYLQNHNYDADPW